MAEKTYKDSYFGELIYDDELIAWVGEISIEGGHQIAVEIDGDDEDDFETIEKAKRLMPQILERENEFRYYSASRLPAGQDAERMANLYAKLKIKAVDFSNDGSFGVEFDDEDSGGNNEDSVVVDPDGKIEDTED